MQSIEQLLERCRKGDNQAMLEMSKFDEEKFANMWLIRAVIYGNTEAREILRRERQRGFRSFLPMGYFIPGGRRESYGNFDTSTIKKAGFDGLPERKDVYKVYALSEARVFILGVRTSYYAPDAYGFGEEEEYSYYVFDEFFHRVSEKRFGELWAATKEEERYFEKMKNQLPKLRIDWLIEDKVLDEFNLRPKSIAAYIQGEK